MTYQYDAFNRLISTNSQQESTILEYDYKDNVSFSDMDYHGFGSIEYYNTYTRKNLLETKMTKVIGTSNLDHYKTRYMYDHLERVIQTHVNYDLASDKSDEKLSCEYDASNRIIKARIHLKDSNDDRKKYQLLANEYLYLKSDIQATSLIKKNVQTVLNTVKDVINYDYDEMGNIIKIESDDNDISYVYDKLGRLTRENNQKLDFSKTFEYDESGNILRSRVYAYTIKELGSPLENNRYSYNQGNYQDQLVGFNGEEMVYDGLGRPITYRDKPLVWSPNGTLTSYDQFNYTYNNEGIRIKKTIGDTTHKYFVSGTKVLLEERTVGHQSQYLKYKYFDDQLYGFNYDNVDYYYIRNNQGDITAIIDKDGTLVASYTYDAWGNHTAHNLTDDHIGDVNPFRYRGYYYDPETKLYYLNARYYDPETGRFISQDNISYLEPETINGLNLYAYCGNNPVMNIDPTGQFFISFLLVSMIVGAVIGGTASGYAAYQSGERGWDLVFDVVGGAIMGSAVGTAVALGGAAGLAATGTTIAGFGLTTTAALGIAVAGTTIAGMVDYSLDVAGSKIEQWNYGSFALSGLEGGLQGASTFGIAYFGGKHGLFNKLGNFGTPSDFFIKMVAQKGTVGFTNSLFYGASMLIGETGSRMLFVSGVGFGVRWIIDKIIYGV